MENKIINQTFYKPVEVAMMLKITKQKVYSDIRTGKLECIKLGDTIRITENQLLNYIGGKIND